MYAQFDVYFSNVLQFERFDDFTLASSWERYDSLLEHIFSWLSCWVIHKKSTLLTIASPFRFISEIEAVCRQWFADGPKNLLVSPIPSRLV